MSEKRKRPFHWKRTKQKTVEPYVSGLLFTCSGNEKQAIREVYNLIDTIVDSSTICDQTKQNSNNTLCAINDEDSGSEDIADTIKRFCKNARETNSIVRHERRMWQRPTGVNNCLFFVPNADLADDVYSLADRIVAMALEKPCCRTLQRVIPVEVTCQVNMPMINREICRLVAKYFIASDDGKWPTYSVDFKARNNSSMKRTIALKMVCEAVSQMAPFCRIDLDKPDIAVLFHVLHNTVLLSCVKRFYQRRKMSLHKERESPGATGNRTIPPDVVGEDDDDTNRSSRQSTGRALESYNDNTEVDSEERQQTDGQ
uniref:THUMP domain-containing protein n=2 Tax=Parascaris univalens TaxID=6257 RepID=A0A915AFE0_PARUN